MRAAAHRQWPLLQRPLVPTSPPLPPPLPAAGAPVLPPPLSASSPAPSTAPPLKQAAPMTAPLRVASMPMWWGRTLEHWPSRRPHLHLQWLRSQRPGEPPVCWARPAKSTQGLPPRPRRAPCAWPPTRRHALGAPSDWRPTTVAPGCGAAARRPRRLPERRPPAPLPPRSSPRRRRLARRWPAAPRRTVPRSYCLARQRNLCPPPPPRGGRLLGRGRARM
mmetsp:Transcript_60993/g.154401  ORF Transcript_60993/g.154401 Transcript_60993/m.154401 type:complete len:220 (-) Transcript_60993:18-677(-)